MSDFVANLSVSLFLFYAIALVSSVVLLGQIALTLFGLDELDLDAGDSVGFLSVRSLTGFFGGFGWTGAILLQSGRSMLTATTAGIAVGLILMLSVVYFMRFLYGLKESGAVDLSNAVGRAGTVYVSIPPHQSGPGQVRVTVQGRLRVVPAYTRAAERIPAERRVTVRGLLDSGALLVEPLEND